ncbi:hypothetical protein ACH5RW_001374 [Enterococcus faecalis]|uniref:hypothetical protein n=1 Tax=unclassified Enterococcus TaxID=2608891 RepID=UPI00280AEC3C|nr:hypothetical protein [Enterococcus faecalis]
MLSVFSESKNEYDIKFNYIIEGKIKIVNDKKIQRKHLFFLGVNFEKNILMSSIFNILLLFD